MSDIFSQVSEDVRNEQLKALWDRYGMLVIGALVLLVLSVGVWVFWQDLQADRRAAAAERFLAGEQLLLDGDKVAASEQFARLAQDTGIAGYRAIAAMKEAAATGAAGDFIGAVAAYDLLAADGGHDVLFRDLASLKAAMLLVDTASADELRLRLAPLVGPDQPWQYSARELQAIVALREGQLADAAATLRGLADDPGAPRSIRARAAEMLEGLPPSIAQPDIGNEQENGASAPAE